MFLARRHEILPRLCRLCAGISVTLIVFSSIGLLWSAIAVIAIGTQSAGRGSTTYAWLVLTLVLSVIRLILASRLVVLHSPLAAWLLEQAPQATQSNVIVIQMPGAAQQPQFTPPPLFYAPQSQEIHHHHHHVQYISTNQYYGHPGLQKGGQGPPGESGSPGGADNPLHKGVTQADAADPAPVSSDLPDSPAPAKKAAPGSAQHRSRPPEGVHRVVVRKVVKSFEAQGPQLARLSPGVSAAPITCNAEVDRAADLIVRVTGADAAEPATGTGGVSVNTTRAAATAPPPPPDSDSSSKPGTGK